MGSFLLLRSFCVEGTGSSGLIVNTDNITTIELLSNDRCKVNFANTGAAFAPHVVLQRDESIELLTALGFKDKVVKVEAKKEGLDDISVLEGEIRKLKEMLKHSYNEVSVGKEELVADIGLDLEKGIVTGTKKKLKGKGDGNAVKGDEDLW